MKKTLVWGMEQLRRFKEMPEAVGRAFTRPDEDWEPVLAIVNGEGKVIFCALRLVMTQESKPEVPGIIAGLVKEHQAQAAMLVVSQWIVVYGPDTPEGVAEAGLTMMDHLGVRNHPRRTEQLAVELCDGKTYETWHAPINRFTDNPPTLGAWEKLESVSMTGRFSNVLGRAFGLVK